MKNTMFRYLGGLLLLIVSFAAQAQFVPRQYITVTPGGTGNYGLNPDGKAGYLTNVSSPMDVAADAAGNVFYTDQGNKLVRMISATDGTITTIAGGGTSFAEGIPATSASIDPTYMCRDAAGNIYITTTNRIRKIDAATGLIHTVAGTGGYGFSGDGLAATAATMNGILGICVDVSGNIYLVDSGNNRVRKVTAATGIISTIAGNGTGAYTGDSGPATAATLHWPTVVAVNAAGDVYVADQLYLYTTASEGMFIRKISASTGIITTVAGNNIFTLDNLFNVHPTDCFLGHITGMCCDGDGNVDCNEISCSCRKIDFTADSVFAVAGNFEVESYADGINSLLAYMNNPYGICVDPSGNLYSADKFNNRIRKIIPLTHAPVFGYKSGQYVYPCVSQSVTLGGLLAIAVVDSAQTENWNVVTGPTQGTLSGFPFTMLSRGTDSLTTPTGIAYTPATGYMGLDSFKIKVTNGSYADYMTIYVSVQTTSLLSITMPSSICTGAALPLSASASGGVWSVTNGNTYIYGDNLYGYNNGLDTILYAAPGVCAASTVMTIYVSPDAGLVSGANLVCLGATATLAETATGGSWTSGSTANATVDASGVVTGISTGTTIITYSVTSGTCTSTSTQAITVGTPVNPIASAATQICLATSHNYTESSAGGTWSLANSALSLSGSGTAVTITGMATGVDTLMYTVSNVCGSNSSLLTITINPLPAAPAITGPLSVCIGSTVTFTASVSGGSWGDVSGNVYTTSGSPIDSLSGLVTGSLAGTDSVSYVVTNGYGCSALTHAPIIVNPLPDAGIITGTATENVGSSLLLTESVGGGTWSTTNTLVTTISGSGLVYGVAPGLDSVVYTVNDGTCTNAYYFPFTVTTIPTSTASVSASSSYIAIMPNPAHSYFQVFVGESENEPVSITITNVTGQKVSEFSGMTNEAINATINVPAGIYYLSASTLHGKYTGKVIVE